MAIGREFVLGEQTEAVRAGPDVLDGQAERQ
jgi:hypothetical protein